MRLNDKLIVHSVPALTFSSLPMSDTYVLFNNIKEVSGLILNVIASAAVAIKISRFTRLAAERVNAYKQNPNN